MRTIPHDSGNQETATARTGEAPAHNYLFVIYCDIIGLCQAAGRRPTINFLHLILPRPFLDSEALALLFSK